MFVSYLVSFTGWSTSYTSFISSKILDNIPRYSSLPSHETRFFFQTCFSFLWQLHGRVGLWDWTGVRSQGHMSCTWLSSEPSINHMKILQEKTPWMLKLSRKENINCERGGGGSGGAFFVLWHCFFFSNERKRSKWTGKLECNFQHQRTGRGGWGAAAPPVGKKLVLFGQNWCTVRAKTQ